MEQKYKQLMSAKLAILNFGTNTRKTAKSKQTTGFFQTRKTLFEQYWNKFFDLYDQVTSEATEEELAAHSISEEDYQLVECAYAETMGEIQDALSKTPTPVESSSSLCHVNHFNQSLPRIKIPPFNGDLLHWFPFKDLFNSIVIKNATLTNTQRLQYLKDSLTGEAQNALDNITTTDGNFVVAWELLQSKYENKRVIINAHLNAVTKLAPAQTESASSLRALLDGATSSIRALQQLGRPVEQWDDWLVFTISNKLDPTTRKAWELSLKSNDAIPTFTELQEFLMSRTQSLEIIQGCAEAKTQKGSQKRSNFGQGVSGCFASSGRCSLCSGKHFVMFCDTFRKKTPHERHKYALQAKLCLNCLRSNHQQGACPSDRRCNNCNAKHHTMLHGFFVASNGNPISTSVNCATKQTRHRSASHVLIGTAVVEVYTHTGNRAVLRCLLDSGSEATFINQAAVNRLNLPRSKVKIPINGASGDKIATATGVVNFTIRSLQSNFEMQCMALVLPRVGNITPSSQVTVNELTEFGGLDLADPQFNVPQVIDIILSAQDYAAVILSGLIRSHTSNLVAQNSQLGWVVFGGYAQRSIYVSDNVIDCYHTQVDMDRTLRKFWELEEVTTEHPFTKDEQYVEEFFQNTTCRTKEGRYIVRLPVKPDVDISDLTPTKHDAVHVLEHLLRRFSRDTVLGTMYEEFMNEYLSLQHMERIAGTSINTVPSCYLPHHGVWKESSTTTKLRVVFNASKRCSSGLSLNDCWFPGPKLQNDLASVVLNWRRYRIALTADITKMYRQILVDDRDVDFQRIVWGSDASEQLSHFRLKTVTYGTNCAPYLAMKVLQTLATDEQKNFSAVTDVLRNEFYVDDVLTGGDSVGETCERRVQLQGLLQAGGFPLRKWNSNSNEVLKTIDSDLLEVRPSHDFKLEGEFHTLGLVWITSQDSLTYKVNLDYTVQTFTKRQVLSDISKLFYPLGLLAPIIIRGKIFIQSLWLTGMDWNDPLPERLQDEWLQYRNELKDVNLVHIPRWLHIGDQAESYELHTFADASIHAYAAVVYLKVVTKSSVDIHLLMSKTRVAPLKKITVPRLELCAAVLGARLITKVQHTLKLTVASMHMWSDSSTVIWWIRSDPGILKDSVANRVSEIQNLTAVSNWKYVRSADNPADCASRGLSPRRLLDHRIWWNGPEWLANPPQTWPEPTLVSPTNLSESKLKKVATAHVAQTNWFILENYSCLDKLLVVTAWCQRFLQIIQKRKHEAGPMCLWQEREAALNFWIKFVQNVAFKNDIAMLEKEKTLPKTSRLLKLHPWLDNNGILRVGGRLAQANIAYCERYPAILPHDGYFTTLIVRQAHQRTLHGGTQATLHFIRRRFWIIKGRQCVKRIVNSCMRCFRYSCTPHTQLMGDLPAKRCNVSHPFMHAGVDYAGPFNVRTTKGRGYRSYKGYVALFVCFATRAIHLELVSDMTTDAFLAALTRFVSVRGICSDIYSDQGTTFVGANQWMKEQARAFKTQLAAAANSASVTGINWHFIPPGAPNFGGLWEAGVKSMKHHLKRVVHENTLTFEEFYTILKQIEASLNSRPLYPISDDPQDLSALTPGHFLVGRPLLAIPEPSVLDENIHTVKRWKLLTQMHQSFWRRWSTEYLQQLQTRNKWNVSQPNAAIGKLVLVRDERLPPRCWVMGRIVDVHTGADGMVRVVTVRTKSAVLKRPISKISLLPIEAKTPSNSEDTAL